MSAKWRALQHRHRYTYSAVVFPQHFTDSLSQLPPELYTLKFFSDLKELASLTSTYSQLTHAKSLASSFGALLSTSDDESLIFVAARYYLEILFLDNSLPLHRTLASALAKSRNFGSLIGQCFRALCEEYGGLDGKDKGKGRSFCVSRAALSMMSTPKLGYLVDVVDECCILVALDIVCGLKSLITETNEWARPSPLVMEQCQEALSCLYYLLQRFPMRFFADSGGAPIRLVGEISSVFQSCLMVIMGILKSFSFSRDCFVAAGVSLCAALLACLNPEELGYMIIECVFCLSTCNLVGDSKDKFNRALAKVQYQGDLCAEIRSFSALSRLCLIRGILTGVSRTTLNTQFVVERDGYMDGGNNNSVQTILYDSILPDLCNYCENPTDSHFNFHALTVMQICLQQIKTSLLSDLIDEYVTSDLFPDDLRARILRIVWKNLEDSLSQTVKQVHLIFDLLLDIQSTLYRGDQGEGVKLYLHKIAGDLLSLGPRCKGRYIPLASLTRRLGAKTILAMNPRLLFETAHAYIDDDVCCASSSFLKCFLEHLRDECWSTDGVERGYEIYRGHCLPPVLSGLASGVPKLRSNLNTYAVPCLLEVDVDSIFPMLAFINVEVGGETGLVYSELSSLHMVLKIEQKVAVFVSLLKVARFLAFFEGDIELCQNTLESGKIYGLEKENALLFIKNVQVNVPVEWLLLALTHVDESLRVDAAESLFLNPKTASLPSHLEIALMRQAVPLNMRCSSTAFQMKWSSLFKKIFSRVRTALERQMKQGIWQPGSSCKNKQNALSNGHPEDSFNRAQDLFSFMKWLSCFLFLSCYPSAPYERKTMAMELIMIMVKTWSIVPPLSGKLGSPSSEEHLYPYNRSLTLPDSTLLLVGSLIDSWDRLRESSFHILLSFPTPLPGISSSNMVSQVISWAKKLVCSPRVRESDAGALTLRLIFRKYVMELGWTLRASSSIACLKSESEILNLGQQMTVSYFPMVEYLKSLIDWLRDVVEEGERDLLQACQNSFVHGVLLALRYMFEELDWNSDVPLACISEMRIELGKLLELVMRITSLALGVVSAAAWYLPEDMDDVPDDASLMMDLPDEGDQENSTKVDRVTDSKSLQGVGPTDQIVMVGCWLAMKEVSLLLGTIIRKIPLPSGSSSDSDTSFEVTDASTAMVLDFKQLEEIGDHFLKVLLKMKHNGAIDKTRAGFTALCNRLLCSNDPSLCRLTESWMEQLMERTIAKGQTVDDLLRRSAGIPAAFSALFLSEPDGAPKKLLPRALRWLIVVASGSLLAQTESSSMDEEISNPKYELGSSIETDLNAMTSKMRVEGVIPMVHAFNVLRAAFNDANLATDTSGFSAEAMIISVLSFSSPHWEVRNSACLAYTALVRRMIGFLNVQKRESARRVLTGLEFFHRYPALHSFIFNELKIATELLGDERSHSNLANVVHPSLCPILILLARLRPSPISSETGDDLDPFLLFPLIQKCSTQSNLRIRVLASRALIGLVSNEKLHSVILKVASELTDRAGCVSLNSIHGVLLQLGALLDTNCRSLADASTRDSILENLASLLVKCSWIGNPRTCPCPTLNNSYLWVLDQMLSIARTCPASKNYDVVCGLLSELSSLCLSLEVIDRSSFYDPTVEELRKQAAISYFSCIFQKSDVSAEDISVEPKNGFTGVEERLVLSISDASYEVRFTTLKWLFSFLKATKSDDLSKVQGAVYKWAKANLHPMLIKLLSMEMHHKCIYYIVRILFLWNVLQIQKMSENGVVDGRYIGDMDFVSVLELWNKLISMYESISHAKTKEALICCLGLCVKHFTYLFRNTEQDSTLLCECISHFVTLIKQHSDASETVTIRKAAAESMVSSGLLEQAEFIGHQITSQNLEPKESVELFAYQILDIWFTCIKLLEDEDVDLRQKLALDVQKCFPNGFRTVSQSGFVPAQVEKVMELSLEFLSSTFGNWAVYFDYLVKQVFDAASYGVVSGEDLIRRVFDKEIDNYHEEKLLICQLCCSHLENLPVLNCYKCDGSSRDEFVAFLKTWRLRFRDQLTSFVNEHVEKLGDAHWIGGVGNHKDAFLPLYGNLLGIFALSKCLAAIGVDIGKDAFVEVVNLGNAIKPFLRNPLIFNLYALVIKLHEEAVGALADNSMIELHGGDGLWDGFDQYFLLR